MAEDESGENEPVYLALEDVLGLHGLIVGGSPIEAADQLRNRDGLESALARPAAYVHTTRVPISPSRLPRSAHGIAEGQQFIDGNKRTALVAMLTFLEINGLGLKASDPELADWILSFSTGATPEEVAQLLRSAAFPVA